MSEHRRRRPAGPAPSDYQEPAHAGSEQSDYAQPRQPRYEQPRYEQPRHEQPRPQQPRYEQPVQNIVVNQYNDRPYSGESYFDGGLLQLIGWSLLAGLIIFITLGFGYPFAACMLYRWEAKHTVINGRRLRFDGTGMQLLGKWILWCLLTIITLGIYSFWLVIKLKQWRTKHTHFA